MDQYRVNAIVTVFATGALIPLAMLPILARVVRRYGRLRGWPMISALGLLGSAVALGTFTVFPLPRPSSVECPSPNLRDYWQTDLFASIKPIASQAAVIGWEATSTSAIFLQVAFNVLLFVPFAFFLHQVTRWNGLGVIVAAFLTSGLIEATQGTGFWGIYPCPYRLLDVDDVVANTIGGVVGVVISYIAIGILPFTTPKKVPDLDPPSLGRRTLAGFIDLALIAVLAVAAQGVQAFSVALTDGREAAEDLLASGKIPLVIVLVAALAIAWLFPALRRDRATPGQVTVNIAPARLNSPRRHAALWQVTVRFAVRWLPMALLPFIYVLVVPMIEFACAVVRRDNRTVSELASVTLTRTRPAIRADQHMAASETQVLPRVE
ncbi:VanZ family protein [Demequina aurantiaca]|uniref:VanZ family protein n=1 Tax=Demequina aurantiaca TaxID=676200 RepID=UPI000782850B|nr:VanZ family protein [Demequina aurantiaca]